MPFTNIIGHEQITSKLERSLQRGDLHHAYLFYGPQQIGKKTIAQELAAELLCEERHDNQRCEQCNSCKLVANSQHPDLMIVQPEEEKNIPISKVREIQKKMIHKPYYLRKVVIIIDQAEFLGKEAQNALLKTLEEPPRFAHLILVTNSPEVMLDTIRSRCQQIEFVPPGRDQMLALSGIEERNRYFVDLYPGKVGKIRLLIDEQQEDEVIEDAGRELQLLNSSLAKRVVYTKALAKDKKLRLREWIQNRIDLWYFGLRYVWGTLPTSELPDEFHKFLEQLSKVETAQIEHYVAYLQKLYAEYKVGKQVEMSIAESLFCLPQAG